MTPLAATFVAMTALVAALLGLLLFAWVRLRASALHATRRGGDAADTMLLSGALQEALTRVKAQEQAMSARAEASEQLSAQVFESLTAGLIVVTGDSRVLILNPAACGILGVEASGAGALFTDLLRESVPIVELIDEGLRTQVPLVRRTVHVRRRGRSWHLGVTVSPFHPSGAAGGGVICLFADLTAVVALEEQLQMKEALARLGELTGGIAHEFRNGLATIHGYARLMAPEQLPPGYRPYLDGIRQETEALGAIVTNFLSYARPETVTWTAVDLEAAARRAADDARQELPEGAMLDVCGTFGAVHGDEVLLRQLFSNLIRNAIEACTARTRTPSIVVRGDRPGDAEVRVRVEDNGPGIAEADRARVFTPFFTTRSRGSGLGLAIVQKIALLHNGRVGVGTSVAGGARVEVVFPAHAVCQDAAAPAVAARATNS